MYRVINENTGLILKNVEEKISIQEYMRLLKRLHEDNITNNPTFIKDYKSYWTMNAARLPQEFFDRYFDYLEKNKNNRQITLSDVIEYLHNNTENKKVHFSFSSKLVHLINPNKPIYDTMIKNFFYLPNFSSKKSYQDKMAVVNKNYNFIESEYKRVIETNLLDPSISLFYKTFKLNQDDITYVKVIDSLIWSLVNLLQNGYIRDGKIIYR